MLQYCFNWMTLSAMAGLTFWNFYFKLYPGAIRSPQVVDFLADLVAGSKWSTCRPTLRN